MMSSAYHKIRNALLVGIAALPLAHGAFSELPEPRLSAAIAPQPIKC